MRKNSIYIHFPYCLRKCNYCDFVSFPCGENVPDLMEYYLKEIEFYQQKFGRKKISSIYFGGGTPSLLPSDVIEVIVEEIYRLYDVDDDVEITLEVNPKTVSDKKLSEFYKVGINRLSIGVQSFDDDELRFLGRIHSSDDAVECIESAKKYFENISCDFIYALPNQSLEKWQKNLEKTQILL